jgi:2-aminoadipate transaminase
MARSLALWTESMPESEIRRLLKVKVPHYFGGGKPGLLPCPSIARVLRELADEYAGQVEAEDTRGMLDDLNYGITQGDAAFRELMAARLVKDGLPATADEMVVTTGSQQMLYSLVDTVTDPGDIVITARPTYLGFLLPVTKAGVRIITVDQDQEGMVTEDLAALLNLLEERGEVDRVKLLYVVADSDNPKGTTLPTERRRRIFQLAERYHFYVLEDAAYRDVQFVERRPAIKSFDTKNRVVIHSRSTSKELASIRVGYTYLPDAVRDPFLKLKGFLDLCTPTLTQRIAERYYRSHYDQALPHIRAGYRRRCQRMGETIDRAFPAGVRTHPTGGFFIWWESEDPSFDAADFLSRVAIPNGVLYVPGVAFYPLKGEAYVDGRITGNVVNKNTMRLSYSFSSEDQLETGMKQLGDLLSRELGQRAGGVKASASSGRTPASTPP